MLVMILKVKISEKQSRHDIHSHACQGLNKWHKQKIDLASCHSFRYANIYFFSRQSQRVIKTNHRRLSRFDYMTKERADKKKNLSNTYNNNNDINQRY